MVHVVEWKNVDIVIFVSVPRSLAKGSSQQYAEFPLVD